MQRYVQESDQMINQMQSQRAQARERLKQARHKRQRQRTAALELHRVKHVKQQQVARQIAATQSHLAAEFRAQDHDTGAPHEHDIQEAATTEHIQANLRRWRKQAKQLSQTARSKSQQQNSVNRWKAASRKTKAAVQVVQVGPPDTETDQNLHIDADEVRVVDLVGETLHSTISTQDDERVRAATPAQVHTQNTQNTQNTEASRLPARTSSAWAQP